MSNPKPRASTSPRPARSIWLAIWLCTLTILALVIGLVTGGLSWLSQHDVAGAIISGGLAFGGAMTLGLGLIGLIYAVLKP